MGEVPIGKRNDNGTGSDNLYGIALASSVSSSSSSTKTTEDPTYDERRQRSFPRNRRLEDAIFESRLGRRRSAAFLGSGLLKSKKSSENRTYEWII
ncbi:hypothetical protein HZH66_009333 [Vespula vulgaris]|uniref:Uncharacterized protein n=1 Tax=Vespula vulgaris TaxID=7454 RepID=A0A834JL45_VESVU|nr:hypothetical protein HZH66_009333 [Vespula vulgaris]